MKIPAGIVDRDVEFFQHNGELMFLFDGKAKSFDRIPAKVRYYLEEELSSDEDACLCLDCLDLHSPMERLRQFVFCRYSSFDTVADMTEGGHMHPEFTTCDKRGHCPYEGILCIQILKTKLSSREIQVIQMLTEDLPYKLIADKLEISTNTVRTHIQNIQSKIGVHSNRAILQWAYEHHYIDEQIMNNSLWETENEAEKAAVKPSGDVARPRTFSF